MRFLSEFKILLFDQSVFVVHGSSPHFEIGEDNDPSPGTTQHYANVGSVTPCSGLTLGMALLDYTIWIFLKSLQFSFKVHFSALSFFFLS